MLHTVSHRTDEPRRIGWARCGFRSDRGGNRGRQVSKTHHIALLCDLRRLASGSSYMREALFCRAKCALE